MEREILLFSSIEPDMVAQVDQWLSALEQSGARTGTMRLNTPGGSWTAGQLIRTRMGLSKVAVTTINEGIVGSAATIIYAAGKVRQCQPHAKFMMHNVSNDVGYTDQGGLEKALNTHKALNRSTAEMYAEVTTTGADEWQQWMSAEKWLSADEAKAIGYCTQILPSRAGLVAPEATMSAAALHGYYMSILSPEPEMKLDEVRNALKLAGVELPATATEAEALSAIGKLRNQAAPAQPAKTGGEDEDDELTKLRKRVEAMEQGRAAEQQSLVETTINAAISQGKITASQKDTFTALLKNDFTNGSKVLAELGGRTSVSQRTQQAQRNTPPPADTTRNDWGFEKWSKEDSAGLRAMKASDPERYQNLLEAYTS